MGSLKSIKKLLRDKDFAAIEEAIDDYAQNDPERFFEAAYSTGAAEKQSFGQHFWLTFFPSHALFKPVLVNERAILLLKMYVRHRNNQSQKVSRLIARHNPLALLSAIRLSRAFLNDTAKISLEALRELDENKYKPVLAAFAALKNEQEKLRSKAINALQAADTSFIEVLYAISAHYEYLKYLHKEKDLLIVQMHSEWYKLILTYEYLTSYCLQYFAADVAFFDGVRGVRKMRTNFEKQQEHYCEALFEVIDAWHTWRSFVFDRLDTFCFDYNMTPSIKEGKVRFSPADASIHITRHAAPIFQMMFWNKIREKSSREVFHPNEGILSQIESKLSTAKDVEDQVIAGRILTDALVSAKVGQYYGLDVHDFHAFMNHALLLSYMQRKKNLAQSLMIKSIAASSRRDWIQQYTGYTLTGKPENFPVFDQGDEWFSKVSSLLGIDEGSSLIKPTILCYDLEKPQKFNDFKPTWDFFKFPFLQINGRHFQIPALFEDVESALLALETVLHDANQEKTRKKETELQELRFAEIFKMGGFEAVYCAVELNPINAEEKAITLGELDVVLKDGNELLFIEIKRSKMLLTPEEVWYEENETIPHAHKQLRKAIKNAKKGDTDLSKSLNTIPEKLAGMNIKGCVFTMTTYLDGSMLSDDIVKTSFVMLAHILKECRQHDGNRIEQFFTLAQETNHGAEMAPYFPKGKHDFELGLPT